MLSDNERRRLARIERELAQEDPELARALAARREDGEIYPPVWVAAVGVLLFVGGLLGLGSMATLIGLAVVLGAAVLPMLNEQPQAVPVRRRRR